MYTITFSDETLNDMIAHRNEGRQVYGAIVCPYSGTFTHKSGGSSVSIPRIVCPYQINDIVAIQEKWARQENGYAYKNGDFEDISDKVDFVFQGKTYDSDSKLYTYTFISRQYIGVDSENEGVTLSGYSQGVVDSVTVSHRIKTFKVVSFNDSTGSYVSTGTSPNISSSKYFEVTKLRSNAEGSTGQKPNCYKLEASVVTEDDLSNPSVKSSNVIRHFWTSNSFRPATTMPDDAVRMYARIVSIRAWTVTKDIVDKYLSIGEIADAYPGTAKVIGYYDRGNQLLSNIRKKWNKEVLAKTYQPIVTYDLPMVDKYVHYRLRESTRYSYSVGSDNNPDPGHRLGVESVFAQSFEAYPVYTAKDQEQQYLDSNFRGWQHTLKSSDDLAMTDPTLEYACKGQGYDPEGGYERYVYYLLDSNGYRIPTYATYKTKIVDPTKYLFAWLISGYLCDKDGKIIGKWF